MPFTCSGLVKFTCSESSSSGLYILTDIFTFLVLLYFHVLNAPFSSAFEQTHLNILLYNIGIRNTVVDRMSYMSTRLNGKQKNNISTVEDTTSSATPLTRSRRNQHVSSSTSSSAELLQSSLINFYRYPTHFEKILPIINRTSAVSLRLLDHFVVNYSATHGTSYPLNDQIFEVHKSYDAQLNKFHKTLFDPFRRGNKIVLLYNDKERIETTLAQLCFFRWCIQNGVLDYVEKHLHAINENMKLHLSRCHERNSDSSISGSSSSSSSSTSSASLGRRHTSRRRSQQPTVTARRTPMNGKNKYIVSFD